MPAAGPISTGPIPGASPARRRHATQCDVAPGQAFGLAEDLGTQTGLDFSGCFLDRFGDGHGLWGGYGTDRIFWARYHADGTWDDAIEVATAPALRGWFADAFGNLTLIYVDGTQAFARRFR